jgi:hypothetical protein
MKASGGDAVTGGKKGFPERPGTGILIANRNIFPQEISDESRAQLRHYPSRIPGGIVPDFILFPGKNDFLPFFT